MNFSLSQEKNADSVLAFAWDNYQAVCVFREE